MESKLQGASSIEKDKEVVQNWLEDEFEEDTTPLIRRPRNRESQTLNSVENSNPSMLERSSGWTQQHEVGPLEKKEYGKSSTSERVETLKFETTENEGGKNLAMVDPQNRSGISTRRKVELDGSKILQSKSEYREDQVAGNVSDSSEVDIVSSDNGEVKLTLMCDSSRRFDLLRLNVGAVLDLVEEKIRNQIDVTNPEFSIRNVLNEFCQSFLETSNYVNNEVILLPTYDTSKKSDSKVPMDDRKHETLTKDGKRNPTFIQDITLGEEKYPISLVNEDGSLELPKFRYIRKNTVYKNAYVNFTLARISEDNCCSKCLGDCLSDPANCPCTRETRGEFAYRPGGLLQEKFLDECIAMSMRNTKKEHFYYCQNCPLEHVVKSSSQKKRKRSSKKYMCKGHLMRKFIKECWVKCGCDFDCGNRTVQGGIKVKLQVFPAPEGKGWGLRTLQELEKGTFVCEYAGEIVTNMELDERNEKRSSNDEHHTYPVLLDADWASERHLKDDDALCLDATFFGNVARFINHRCYDANLVEIPVEVEAPDHHYYHLAFFTTRKVEAYEELSWDYGIDFDDETHPIKAFNCKCGSPFCGMQNMS